MSVVFRSANTDFARRGDRAYIHYLCDGADVIALQEAKDGLLADKLPEGWRSLQHTATRARMGSCLAIRTDTIKLRTHYLRLGSRPYIDGRRVQMLTRYTAVALLTERDTKEPFAGVSTHWPKQEFASLQPGHTRKVEALVKRRPRVILGTDANQPIHAVGRELGLNAYGEGIVGVLTNFEVADIEVDNWGKRNGYTDHPLVSVTADLHRMKGVRS